MTAIDPNIRADRPTAFTPRGWRDVIVRTWREASRDNVGLIAAGISFYAFLALLPLLAAIVLIYGLVADPQTVIQHVREFSGAMPVEAAAFLAQQLMFVVTTAAEKKGLGLITALALSLFSARAAAGALITALNIVYEEEEKRGLIAFNLTSILITVGGVMFGLMGLVAGASIALLANATALDANIAGTLAKIVGSTVSALSVAVIAGLLYRLGPCRSQARWRWVIPGALLFAAVWVALTFGFGFYVSNFGRYGATYGSLATIVIFLTWMFATSYAFLLGGELNSELEHQTARDSTTGAERPIGTRGAWMADHVAGGLPHQARFETPEEHVDRR